MEFPEDQIAELKRYCTKLLRCDEANGTYFLLEGLALPAGCEPSTIDALLCPFPRDNYNSRLFFSERIRCPKALNWNASGVRIAERNWEAYSYGVTRTGLRLAEILAAHLRALT